MKCEWISIKDRLPETIDGDCSDEVLIVVDGEVVTGTSYFVDGIFADDFDNIFKLKEVSHWMYLPNPPKEACDE